LGKKRRPRKNTGGKKDYAGLRQVVGLVSILGSAACRAGRTSSEGRGRRSFPRKEESSLQLRERRCSGKARSRKGRCPFLRRKRSASFCLREKPVWPCSRPHRKPLAGKVALGAGGRGSKKAGWPPCEYSRRGGRGMIRGKKGPLVAGKEKKGGLRCPHR